MSVGSAAENPSRRREGFPPAGHTNLRNDPTDRELVERLLRGERAAFEQFFNEYYPKLYRFVKRRMPHDAAAAEDIAQATLCRALESLRSYRGEAALMTWLCTICRREMSARWQENARLERGAARWPRTTRRSARRWNPCSRASRCDPLRAADREQVRESILAALDYLPAPYGDILEWKYLRDMSMAEIARAARPFAQGGGVAADARARGLSRSLRTVVRRRDRSATAMNPDPIVPSRTLIRLAGERECASAEAHGARARGRRESWQRGLARVRARPARRRGSSDAGLRGRGGRRGAGAFL